MLVFASILTEASTLSVYQDKALYQYHPQNTFIGLTRDIGAKCEGEAIPLSVMMSCPDSMRLCMDLFLKAESLQTSVRENALNTKLLDTFVKLPKPNSINAKETIGAAREIAKEQTRLQEQKRILTRKSQQIKARFAKETRARMPLGFAKPCKGSAELSLLYGYITF